MTPIRTASALALAAGLGLAWPALAQDAATTPDEDAAEAEATTAPDAGTSGTGASDSTTSEAAGSEAGGASEEELREAAQRYIESDGVQQMMDGMFSPEMLTSMMEAQAGGQIPPEEMEEISRIVSDVLEESRPAMEEAMVTATAETFTLPEIEAQIEFYQSPEGAAVMSKMQPFMAAFNEEAAPAMQSMQEELMTRISEALQPQE